ncbi:hypothetical protein NC651_010426 [Populus alba x Populus x berolinensis]|nr:hypothetical protein NC651_010426 [Populus alba x Populus x berolinensis]
MGEPQFQKLKYIYKFDVNQWKLLNLLHWIYQTFRYFGAVFDSLASAATILELDADKREIKIIINDHSCEICLAEYIEQNIHTKKLPSHDLLHFLSYHMLVGAIERSLVDAEELKQRDWYKDGFSRDKRVLTGTGTLLEPNWSAILLDQKNLKGSQPYIYNH